MAEPRPELAVAGDECDSCRAFWVSQDLPPKTLVSIYKQTDRRKIAIVVCPFCDGEPILRRNAANELHNAG